MTAAKKYVPHYTVDDYSNWEGDWELWNGIAVSMTPSPFGPHQAALFNLAGELRAQLRAGSCDAVVLGEIDWIVSRDTVVRPDVVVLCGAAPQRHIETTPTLVAEVISESTENRDRNYKRDLYDKQGVSVYLLIDPIAQTLEIYQRDSVGAWQHQEIADSVDVQICDSCRLRLDRTSIFEN